MLRYLQGNKIMRIAIDHERSRVRACTHVRRACARHVRGFPVCRECGISYYGLIIMFSNDPHNFSTFGWCCQTHNQTFHAELLIGIV